MLLLCADTIESHFPIFYFKSVPEPAGGRALLDTQVVPALLGWQGVARQAAREQCSLFCHYNMRHHYPAPWLGAAKFAEGC